MKRLLLVLVISQLLSVNQSTFAQTTGDHSNSARTSRRADSSQTRTFNNAAEELMMRSRQLNSKQQLDQGKEKRSVQVAALPFKMAVRSVPNRPFISPLEDRRPQVPTVAKRALSAAAPLAKNPFSNQESVVEDQIQSGVTVVGTDIIAPPGINVGQESQLTVVANNMGDQSVSQVNLFVQLPPHLDFVRATPPAVTQKGQLLEFRISNLAASSNSEVVLTVIPKEKLPLRIVTEIQTVNHSQIEIAVQEPKISVQAEATPQAIVGDTVHHVIRVTNSGDGIADDLQLKMVLPKDMVPLAGKNDLFVGDLAPGMTRELTFETRSSQSGAAIVEYLVSGTNILAKDKAEIAVVWPELHVELLGPKVNIVSRPGDYTIRLNNPSEIAITSTKVSLEIPAGLDVTTLSREGSYNAELRTIEWDLATMQPGAEETIQFRAHLLKSTAQTCKVTVESVETQANQLALETKPYSHTALKLAMQNKTGAIVVGDTAEFELVASNEGATNAENVLLEVEIPSWMEPVPNSGYQFDRENSVIRFLPQEIEEAGQKQLTFEATCNKAGNFVVRSTLHHPSQSRPLISDASLFILDGQQEKIGGIVSPEKVLR